MDNNYVFRQLRYALDLRDHQLIELMQTGGMQASISNIQTWLKKEEEEEYVLMPDQFLAAFLNGLIINHRGKKEGVEMKAEKLLNNNLILRKLKIAFNLTTEQIAEIFSLGHDRLSVSNHEITAFFRNPKQSQYRKCQDQFLRVFLRGFKAHCRNGSAAEDK